VLLGVSLGVSIAAAAPPVAPTASRAEIERWFRSLPNSSVINAVPRAWQYSFTAANGRALETLSVALVRDGYEIVALEEGRVPTLLMAKIELHSPSTLVQRAKDLQRAAGGYGARYTGVGFKE